ncbi:hypothetical protein TWF106_005092 [Orbilia oligospora]|uniref:Uncharacterized protein n=1 Tax=Orbilia oligospora TaxID=2813651 RepID=A0A7C8UX85_ORBOL|nr:hypothetical protein TWF106_005092 [Orbilia oligospora]
MLYTQTSYVTNATKKMSGGGPFFNQDKAKHSLEDLRSEVFNLSGISLSIEHEIQEAITCIIDEKLRPLIQEIVREELKTCGLVPRRHNCTKGNNKDYGPGNRNKA